MQVQHNNNRQGVIIIKRFFKESVIIACTLLHIKLKHRTAKQVYLYIYICTNTNEIMNAYD